MSKPRVLPRVAKDVVHIIDGRRVVTIDLPARGPVGSERNYQRSALVAKALRVRKLGPR